MLYNICEELKGDCDYILTRKQVEMSDRKLVQALEMFEKNN